MSMLLSIRFRPTGKIYNFRSGKYTCKINDFVIVNTSKGIECGKVVKVLDMTNNIFEEQYAEIKSITRIATPKDIRQYNLNMEHAVKAFEICSAKVKSNNLNMKIVDVEYMFDCKKILFYFSADGKVDFRNLVKDLAAIFRTRIELRQIGVRDQSQILGGLGICGRPFCCSTFLNDFHSVSIKMAKEQGLSLNPVKISGTCGRLMCCLDYEQEAYEHLIKTTPCNGSYVSTPDGNGIITDVNLITGNIKVLLDNSSPSIPIAQTYHKKNIKIIKNGNKGHYSHKKENEELKYLENL